MYVEVVNTMTLGIEALYPASLAKVHLGELTKIHHKAQ